jgi:serine/threonine protein kinase
VNKRNEQATEIFADAIVITDPDSRRRFVESACDSDELLNQVHSWLSDYERAADFLESPAIEAYPGPHIEPLEMVGSFIGRYKLLEIIGEGGFGIVYMAEQKEPIRRRVALKVIKPGMDTREVIARFEAERQALAMMDHPNIARVMDAGATKLGRPYFVMELVKGVPITQFCNENRLPNRKRMSLFTDVCRAVQHAHQKGVIHRDLKPSNVMATIHNGEPFIKIIDFGVAKAINIELTEKTLFTSYGQLVGTPQYMSPEQAQISSVDAFTIYYAVQTWL